MQQDERATMPERAKTNGRMVADHEFMNEFRSIMFGHGDKLVANERYYGRMRSALYAIVAGVLAFYAGRTTAQSPWTPDQTASFEAWSQELVAIVRAGGYDEAYDANGDTAVTSADLSAEIARINALPPPASIWPEGSWDPATFAAVVEADRDLPLMAGIAQEGTLFVVRGEALNELRTMARASDERMDGCFFTAAPDEFGRHTLEVVVTRPMDTGFQGFTLLPGDDGYGARHTSTGRAWYSWCGFAGGVKGIAVTGAGADIDLVVTFCDFRDIHGGVSAGVYSVRGTARIEDSIFDQIGYPRGGERPRDALLKHGAYLQWECVGEIRRCWFRNMASHAAQLRGGGLVEDSIAVNTANGFLIGHDKADRPDVAGTIRRTIVEGTTDVGTTNTGVGLWVEHAAVRLIEVVVANNASRGEGAALRPLNRAQVTIESLFSLDIPRVLDVNGTQLRIVGPIMVEGESRRIGSRPGSSTVGVTPSFVPVEAGIPALGSVPEPDRGEVGEMVADLLGQIGR